MECAEQRSIYNETVVPKIVGMDGEQWKDGLEKMRGKVVRIGRVWKRVPDKMVITF